MVQWCYGARRPALRRRIGVAADPRAYLVYRAFRDEAVEIRVDDPADPHPYWLISTRDANAFAEAIETARVTAAAQGR